jgi:MoxR-like ATPase
MAKNKEFIGTGLIENVEFDLTKPLSLNELEELQPPKAFVPRNRELNLCRAAWGLDRTGRQFKNADSQAMHFRLEGPPGVGKNAIVYYLASQLKMPLYVIQGHEDLTPEDLSLALVPTNNKNKPFVLRAGPVASAIYTGGLIMFDEINRVPQRALAPLASVLDARQSIFSAMANIWIKRSAEAEARFRFCCAMNPAAPDAGDLPDYLNERTLPAIRVDYFELPGILKIIANVLDPPDVLLDAYKEWHDEQQISARVAISIVRMAMSLAERTKMKSKDAIKRAADVAGLQYSETTKKSGKRQN